MEEDINCSVCSVRQVSLFAEVPDSSLDRVDFQPIVSRHKAGEILVHACGHDDAVYTIREGMVKIERELPDGGRRIVRLLKRGDTLGLHAWRDGLHLHRAVSLGEVELCRIPHRVIDTVRRESRELDDSLLQRFNQDCRMADRWITDFSSGAVTRRVALLLLYLAELQATDRLGQVTLLSRDDMAAALGVRQESISRTITRFKAEGLIRPVTRDTFEMECEGLKQRSLK